MRLRMRVIQRSREGVEAAIKAKNARQRLRVRQATVANAEEEFGIDQGLVPRRTNFLANHMELHFTNEGRGYVIGFFRDRFVGQENPVTKQVVTHFYARDVVEGNTRQAGNDFLSEGARLMRAKKRQRYAAALRG